MSSLSFSAFAKTVTGTVKDAATEAPIVGVVVYEKGSVNNAVITDKYGRYALDVENENSVLMYIFLGYITQEINVGNRSVINVWLQPNGELDILRMNNTELLGLPF